MNFERPPVTYCSHIQNGGLGVGINGAADIENVHRDIRDNILED